MARITISIKKNADRTYTVKVGKAIEHIGTDGKDRGQIFDAIKYAAISKGVYLRDPELVELLDKNSISIETTSNRERRR